VRRALGLALFFAALAAGCGGGGGDGLSQEEFRQQADAICEKYDKKIQALGSPQSPADIPAYVQKGIPLLRQGIAELRALNPPADVEDDYNRMLNETAKAIPAAEKLADAAEKGDTAAVQDAIREGQQADEASDELATKLKLDRCAAD
jgi:hypothetical protein